MNTSTPAPLILLCPGQGAQHVGMGLAWAQRSHAAVQLFQQADDILHLPLSRLCFQGPEDQLQRTDIAQPAIYTTSVACFLALQEQGLLTGPIAAAAGLSLGEFTALHLAGAFDFASGLRLVHLRGQAMQQAAEASPGAMLALTGASPDQAQTICQQAASNGQILQPANFNCPGQIVLSGHIDACRRAQALAEQMGLKSLFLKVAGAFHSPLMQPAADRLRDALEQISWSTPRFPVLANVTAQPHASDPTLIKQRLAQQLTSPVLWEQSMRWLIANIPAGRFVELAPGKVLQGLMRRIDAHVKVDNYAQPPAEPDQPPTPSGG